VGAAVAGGGARAVVATADAAGVAPSEVKLWQAAMTTRRVRLV
jgi:hypothetical protein